MNENVTKIKSDAEFYKALNNTILSIELNKVLSNTEKENILDGLILIKDIGMGKRPLSRPQDKYRSMLLAFHHIIPGYVPEKISKEMENTIYDLVYYFSLILKIENKTG